MMLANGRSNRRSLKESIKTILHRRRDKHADRSSVTSASLNNPQPSLALLPDLSSVSSLPSFGSSRFDVNNYSVETIVPIPHTTTRIWATDRSRETIVLQNGCHDRVDSSPGPSVKSSVGKQDYLPRSSFESTGLIASDYGSSQASLVSCSTLSTTITPECVQLHSPISQLARTCAISRIYGEGTSLQASLATPNRSKSCRTNTSTLRLYRSDVALPAIEPTTIQSLVDTDSLYSVESSDISQKRSLRRSPRQIPPLTVSVSPTSRSIARSSPVKLRRQSKTLSAFETGLSSVKHFKSFCVLDGGVPGYPVTATSDDLKHVFDIGDQFMLNTAAIDDVGMDTCIGQDAEGNTIVHLVIHSPLINPNSGRSRFVLASLLDITNFIQDTASLPDLEIISDKSTTTEEEEEIRTPQRRTPTRGLNYELSAEDLLGGCYISSQYHTPNQPIKDDIWLEIATEESRLSRPFTSSPSTPRSSSVEISARSVDDIMDQFLADLQLLYSEFFVLGQSPLDEESYEICNVSRAVHESRDYIEGHLSKTPTTAKQNLERQLTYEKAFDINVRWGERGDWRQMFCIPLFGRNNVTWICFLVDEHRWLDIPLS